MNWNESKRSSALLKFAFADVYLNDEHEFQSGIKISEPVSSDVEDRRAISAAELEKKTVRSLCVTCRFLSHPAQAAETRSRLEFLHSFGDDSKFTRSFAQVCLFYRHHHRTQSVQSIYIKHASPETQQVHIKDLKLLCYDVSLMKKRFLKIPPFLAGVLVGLRTRRCKDDSRCCSNFIFHLS